MVLRLTLTILNGPLKGQRFPLFRGQTFNGSQFFDETMIDGHAEIDLDPSLMWVVRLKRANPETAEDVSSSQDPKQSRIRMGSVETEQVSLIPGVVFNIGQTGFKVIEIPVDTGIELVDMTTDWLEGIQPPAVQPRIKFFNPPLRLTFLKGPQANEIYTLTYGPRVLGYSHSDLNLIEPGLAFECVEFNINSIRPEIKKLTHQKILINDENLTEHFLSNGDILKIGSNEIEITFLD